MLSRVADSLYWMSRYLERAEHTSRLVDVHLNLMLDQGPDTTVEQRHRLLESLNVKLEDGDPPIEDVYSIARWLTFDSRKGTSIVTCILRARENARQVREEISTEMWEQLNRLYLKARAPDAREEWAAQPHEFFSEVKESAHLFQGVADGTLRHGESWRFVRIGRSLERAGATSQLLRANCPILLEENSGAGSYLEWVGLLRACTSFEAYCKQYTAEIEPNRILEYLLLDAQSPRSVRFCADRLEKSLIAVADETGRNKTSNLMRAAGKLRSTLDYSTTADIMKVGLGSFLADVRRQCGQIHSALFATYIGYTADVALTS